MTNPRRLAKILALAASAGCARSDAAAPEVVRTDSAGITIVRNEGADHPLEWTFTEVLRLGGEDEGPEAFYELNPYAVRVDGAGRLHVLDGARQQVQIFAADGRHLRTLGSRGAGPGELESVSMMDVSADGRVSVRDYAKPALVEWDSAGNVLASEPLSIPLYSPFRRTGDTLVAPLTRPRDEGGFWERLAVMTPRDTTVIVESARPTTKMIDFGCVGLNLPPRFHPALVWDAAPGRVAAAMAVPYDLHLRRSDGDRLRIRRDLTPREVTREMALRDLDEGMEIRFQGRDPCVVPPEVVLEKQGYETALPMIAAIRLSPDGTIWVRRSAIRDEPAIIDLFAADGAYLGTLPAGSLFPATFLPDGSPVMLESDEMDIDRVVVYRIDRP